MYEGCLISWSLAAIPTGTGLAVLCKPCLLFFPFPSRVHKVMPKESSCCSQPAFSSSTCPSCWDAPMCQPPPQHLRGDEFCLLQRCPRGRAGSPFSFWESTRAAPRPFIISLDVTRESVHLKQDYFWVANCKVNLALIPFKRTGNWSDNDSPGGLS